MKKTIAITILLSALLLCGTSCHKEEETTTKGGLKVNETGTELVIDFKDLTEETTEDITEETTTEAETTTEKSISEAGANTETGWGPFIKTK